MICQKNVAARVRGLIFLYIYIENFKNLRQKPLDWFRYNLAEMFPCWPSTKIVHHDSSKNLAARGRGLFSLYIYIEKF